jgi:hypothetical protein
MSKVGLLGRAIGSLISLVTRTVLWVVQHTSLAASLGLTVYTIGEYTHKFIQDKPQVQEVLLWRNPKNSAIALAVSLLSLILVAKFTFLSLLAWGSLVVLGATLGFRVFKLVEAQVKKTDGTNPFKPYLEPEINVPQEKVHAQADLFVHHGQAAINQLRRLFLVENVFDSVKFGVLLWTLTYIGAWFSGITLVTLFVLGLFSVPKLYELYKEPIDEYVGLARQNVEKVNHIVQEKLPFLKQQAEAKVEKKEE